MSKLNKIAKNSINDQNQFNCLAVLIVEFLALLMLSINTIANGCGKKMSDEGRKSEKAVIAKKSNQKQRCE